MRKTTVEPGDRWARAAIVAWAIVGILLVIAAAGWMVAQISSALVPFGLGLIIVLLFRGPVAVLEARGWKRSMAVLVFYLIGMGILVGVGLFVIPHLADQVSQFVEAFPRYYDKAYELLLDLQARYRTLALPTWAEDALMNMQERVAQQFGEWSAALAKGAVSAGSTAVEFLFNGFLALVIGFWTLKDLPQIRKEFVLLAGPNRRVEASMLAGQVSRVLSGYLKGQLILSTSTAILVTIGMTLIGVPYSLVIGLVAGVLNVIPWVGPAIVAVVAAIAASVVSPLLIFAALAVEVASQQFTEIFIQPRVMSEQVDLHPLAVIFSLLVGGAAFGFVGLLLAIPVAAVLKGLFVYYFEKYTDSKIASEEGALFRVRPDDECDIDTEADDASDADGKDEAEEKA